MSYSISKNQARRFILIKQGLLGDYKFIGKEGIMEFVQQAGCVQYDPIDVCGKNAELVLQSRVKGFTKKMLYDLLYVDRQLIDYFDKNLAIININDWKYFERIQEANRISGRGFWFELDFKVTKKLCSELNKCYRRFMKFHGFKDMLYSDGLCFMSEKAR